MSNKLSTKFAIPSTPCGVKDSWSLIYRLLTAVSPDWMLVETLSFHLSKLSSQPTLQQTLENNS